VVVNSKKSRFSRMMLGVGRLIGIEENISTEMRSKAVLNNTLSTFRQMRDIIVGEFLSLVRIR